MAWLDEIPACVVDAMLKMLPRLQAEESLEGATVAGVGAGVKPGAWIKTQFSEWERRKNDGETPRKKRGRRLSAQALRMMGVGVELVNANG